jgi:hypothetical protein
VFTSCSIFSNRCFNSAFSARIAAFSVSTFWFDEGELGPAFGAFDRKLRIQDANLGTVFEARFLRIARP